MTQNTIIISQSVHNFGVVILAFNKNIYFLYFKSLLAKYPLEETFE